MFRIRRFQKSVSRPDEIRKKWRYCINEVHKRSTVSHGVSAIKEIGLSRRVFMCNPYTKNVHVRLLVLTAGKLNV